MWPYWHSKRELISILTRGMCSVCVMQPECCGRTGDPEWEENKKTIGSHQTPKEIHCRAHTNKATEQSQGNALADSAVKAATRQLLII